MQQQGDDESRSRKRKPLVPTKASSATLSTRRPAALKVNNRSSAVQKAAAPVNPMPMSAEEVELRNRAPALGLAADAVRAHCLGKLEAAFIKVYKAYYQALGMAQDGGSEPIPEKGLQQYADGVSFSWQYVQGRRCDQAMDADLTEVAPPIRVTEPIVLDEEEIPDLAAPSTSQGHDRAMLPSDSGLVQPVSSSIEILAVPQSSQQSVGNLHATSQIRARESIVPHGLPHEAEMRENAIGYAREVEQALFEKTKFYSREKVVWLAGSSYK